ncbi:MAG: glycosyltransferase [Pyrinomonadaceae bacterium]|nr:glycosyltransferase [Pyrinomonadaceae bacterium]
MTENKRLSIILPIYNDARIADAIRSVRRFDDIGTVRLIVIDGGSKQEVRDMISTLLAPGDVFISEPDDGIFDALNKGLRHCGTEFIGWLGSDDLFTGKVLAGDVVCALENHDLFVAGTAVFRGHQIRRVTHALPSRFRLAKFGLHNPHFSTFGRAEILKSDRFELGIRGADIAYFIRIFAKKPKVMTSGAIATLMGEGGFSTNSYCNILLGNLQLLPVYLRHTNVLIVPFVLLIKLGYKSLSLLYYKVFKLERAALESRW